MITRDNLPEVIKKITPQDEERIRNSSKDYVILNLHIFNAGSVLEVSLTRNVYGNKKIREAEANGGCLLETNEVISLIDKSKE